MDTSPKQLFTAFFSNYTMLYIILLLLYLVTCVLTINNLHEDYLINNSYELTSCTVMKEKKLSSGQGSRSKYEQLFLVQYEANKSQLHQSWRPLNRIHPWTASFNFRNEFSVGSTIPCWYDPNLPDKVYLQKGYHIMQGLFLLSSTILFLCFFLLLLVNKKGGSLISNKHYSKTSGEYLIRENLFLSEYTYLGKKPMYPEMLPKRFQNTPIKYQNKLTDTFNLKGKMIFIRQPFVFLLNLMFIPAAIIFLGILFLTAFLY